MFEYFCMKWYGMSITLVAFLAQSVERAALNRAVVGSRPTGGVLFVENIK